LPSLSMVSRHADSMQVVPLSTDPAGHPQLPELQTWLFWQTMPHAPQLFLSVCRLEHVLPHWFNPALQRHPQVFMSQ
jgi:hypothetical protein